MAAMAVADHMVAVVAGTVKVKTIRIDAVILCRLSTRDDFRDPVSGIKPRHHWVATSLLSVVKDAFGSGANSGTNSRPRPELRLLTGVNAGDSTILAGGEF